MNTTRRHLTELAALSHQTERAERNILARAESALERCQADITRLRPAALIHGAAEAREYQQAVLDRGKLMQVIAQARKLLAAAE